MDVKKVLEAALKDLQSATTQQDLYEVRVSYLGKKGKITDLLKALKDLSLEEKNLLVLS
jgi:phenylalanyl-tRNA synthetase alpha chain